MAGGDVAAAVKDADDPDAVGLTGPVEKQIRADGK